MAEPVRKVTIGIELSVVTAQLNDDWDDLTAIRQEFANIGDRLMKVGPGNRAVSLTWSVDRVARDLLFIPQEGGARGHEG